MLARGLKPRRPRDEDQARRSPEAELRHLMEGFERSQLVYVAVKLGLPGLLADGAADAAALAPATGVEESVLYRLLRGLAWCGVVAHQQDDRFALTAVGRLLRPDADRSLAERARSIGEVEYPAWGALLRSLGGDDTAFETVFGRDLYGHLAQEADLGSCFDAMMARSAVAAAEAVAAAYDFSGVETVVDVGGGDGTLLAKILDANPHLRGVLFDRPAVVERYAERLADRVAAGRLTTVGGDFFDRLPAGADVYLLKWILHNWPDGRCRRLLETCRRAGQGRARLLVVEQVMPERVDPSTDLVSLDLGMLVHLGGRERTEEEFRRLFDGAGFRLARIRSTRTDWSLIEGVADGSAPSGSPP